MTTALSEHRVIRKLFLVLCEDLFRPAISSELLPAATKLGQGNKFTGVYLSTGGGGVSPIFQEGGCLKFGGSEIFRGGVSPIFQGVSPNFFFFFFNFFSPQKSFWDAPPQDGQCAAGMHPTGMHSCYCRNASVCEWDSTLYLALACCLLLKVLSETVQVVW